MNIRNPIAIITIAFLALSSLSTKALATLGGDKASVENDRLAAQAEYHSAPTSARTSITGGTQSSSSFTVYEYANSAQTIRQYVDTNGVVFAITWKGITHPDLEPLLGKYYKEHGDAARVQNTVRKYGRHNQGAVKSPNVIVEKSGHMRSVQGRAYVPSLVPAGVKPEEIN